MAKAESVKPKISSDKEAVKASLDKKRIYPIVKRVLDTVCAALALLVLWLPMVVISIVIVSNSRGPALFKQKRVGKDKKHFTIYKFRTMYSDTDANIPTHLLKNPDQFLTPVGKFLRKTSLDELPQLINIFLGQMSFVGPRPALWNQFDLIEMRDRVGANSVVPGLSGWAQVNGRDELLLTQKVKFDGEYASKQSFFFDIKCMAKTVSTVVFHRGVVEGGTGFKLDRPVRICMVTTISKAFEWFVSDNARNFASKGFEVTVMCGEMTDEFIEKHSQFAKCRPLPLVRGMSISSMLRSIKEIGRIFREERFDIIQYATPNAALCCSLARGFKKIRIRVYGQWGIRYVGFESGLKRFFFKRIEKLTCKRATHIISTSPKNMEYAISEKLCERQKITVIGKGGTIGVDFGVFDINRKQQYRESIRRKYGIDDGTLVFGFIGRLNRDKGVGELISAYRAFVHEHPNSRLFLVGMEDNTNPPDEELIRWARSCDNCLFTGSVSPDEVAQYMSATDIIVHPTYREGFSMVLQEAMAMALPVITTDVPGPSEVIVDGVTGVLVPDHNDEALLREMKALADDKARIDYFAENGRRRVEMFFARPIMLKNIYRHYCRLLGIDDKHIRLMYLTDDPKAAVDAENAGVDRIFLDLEIIGKEERQRYRNTFVTSSTLEDVARLRAVIKKAEFLVRCNPIHQGSREEIDRIIKDGADMIMLPYFKSADEAKQFIDFVGGRVRTVLLFETAKAVENVDEILSLDGIDEAYIGLNDLHLSYDMSFMFELLAKGTVDMLCEKFRKRGIPYGFGGIAKIGEGLLKSDDIIGEHKRLGSTVAILSRTFRNELSDNREPVDLNHEIELIRRREAEVESWDRRQLEENRIRVAQAVSSIVAKITNKQ